MGSLDRTNVPRRLAVQRPERARDARVHNVLFRASDVPRLAKAGGEIEAQLICGCYLGGKELQIMPVKRGLKLCVV